MLDSLPDRCLERIDTDRPHQTDTPNVIPAGHYQLESAVVDWQLGALRGRMGVRAPHMVLLDDSYALGLCNHVELQMFYKHSEFIPQTKELVHRVRSLCVPS